MIEVHDLSRYQADDTVGDAQGGVILNIEDPSCAQKATLARDRHVDCSLYSWLYPGRGAQAVRDLQAMVERLDVRGVPVTKGGFVDFEANGVATKDLREARAATADIATPVGAYTYLYLLNSLPGLADEWWQWSGRWIAYYPGQNDGSYPAWAIGDAVQWGSMLWQYSSGGNLDRNVVVAEAAWHAWGSPSAPDEEEEDVISYITKQSDQSVGIWATDGIWRRHVGPDEWNAVHFVASLVGKPPPGVRPVTDQEWATLPDVALAVVAPPAGGAVLDPAQLSSAVRAELEQTKLTHIR